MKICNLMYRKGTQGELRTSPQPDPVAAKEVPPQSVAPRSEDSIRKAVVDENTPEQKSP